MNKTITTACAFALALLAHTAGAHEYQLGQIRIIHPWARASLPGQTTGGAYLAFDNKGPADRLLSVSTPASASAEVHAMSMKGNTMEMRKLDSLDVPAGQTTELKPGGQHIMLLELKTPLKQGTRIPLRLKFEKAGETTVEVAVDSATASPAGGHAH